MVPRLKFFCVVVNNSCNLLLGSIYFSSCGSNTFWSSLESIAPGLYRAKSSWEGGRLALDRNAPNFCTRVILTVRYETRSEGGFYRAPTVLAHRLIPHAAFGIQELIMNKQYSTVSSIQRSDSKVDSQSSQRFFEAQCSIRRSTQGSGSTRVN